MARPIEPRNERTSDELIDDYLRGERTAQALRLLWVGLVIAICGAVATGFVWRWFVYGGFLWRPMLVGPFAVVAGVPIAFYGLVQLARARAE